MGRPSCSRAAGRVGWLVIALAPVLAIAATPAAAQPAAPPGTICIVPGGWCWAIGPGISGQPCQCPTQNGWVSGTYN